MNWVVALAWVVGRLKEPSTYAGMAGLLASYHFPHSADVAPLLAQMLMAAASIIAIFLPERSQ